MKLVKFTMLLLICLALSACGNSSVRPKNISNISENIGYPVTVNNYNSDRSRAILKFYNKPKRVIANQQNTIETLLALEEDNAIVAAACTSNHTTEFLSKYKARIEALPVLSRHDFDLETALMLHPDFIVGWQSTFSNRALRSTEFWRNRGVNTYIVENSNSILHVGRVEDEYTFINNMGKIFHKEALAQDMLQEMEAEITDAVEKSRHRDKQNVLIIEAQGNNIVVYGKNRLGGDMVTKLGGSVMECGSRIGAENLIQLNPDVIFVVCIGWQEDAQACIDGIINNKAYRSIKAIKNKRVYAIPLMYMYASATRTLDGIRVFKQGLYPDVNGEME